MAFAPLRWTYRQQKLGMPQIRCCIAADARSGKTPRGVRLESRRDPPRVMLRTPRRAATWVTEVHGEGQLPAGQLGIAAAGAAVCEGEGLAGERAARTPPEGRRESLSVAELVLKSISTGVLSGRDGPSTHGI